MSAVILKRGDIGPAVKEVRDRLVQLGLLPAQSGSSEIFDDELFAAVRVFQQSRGLTVDGIVGLAPITPFCTALPNTNMGAAAPWSVPLLALLITRLPNSLKVIPTTRSSSPSSFISS